MIRKGSASTQQKSSATTSTTQPTQTSSKSSNTVSTQQQHTSAAARLADYTGAETAPLTGYGLTTIPGLYDRHRSAAAQAAASTSSTKTPPAKIPSNPSSSGETLSIRSGLKYSGYAIPVSGSGSMSGSPGSPDAGGATGGSGGGGGFTTPDDELGGAMAGVTIQTKPELKVRIW